MIATKTMAMMVATIGMVRDLERCLAGNHVGSAPTRMRIIVNRVVTMPTKKGRM